MARQRMIKPDFWSSEQIIECSTNARLLFIGMWNFCDDAGICPASIKSLKAKIFPSDEIDSTSIRRMIDELIMNRLIIEYEVDSKLYFKVTGWDSHQKIDRPTFQYPKPNIEKTEKDEFDSTNDRRSLDTKQSKAKQREENKKAAAFAHDAHEEPQKTAAAALSESEIQNIIEKIVEIRNAKSPVDNKPGLKITLRAAYDENPEKELFCWNEDIEKAEKQVKDAKIKANEQEVERKKAAELERQRAEKEAEFKEFMQHFDIIPEEERITIWDQAVEIEKMTTPRPFPQQIKNRVVLLMKERGIVPEGVAF